MLTSTLSPLAGLFPDWLFARKACMEPNAYMNTRVDRTLALPREELLKKEQKMNLMEILAVNSPIEGAYLWDSNNKVSFNGPPIGKASVKAASCRAVQLDRSVERTRFLTAAATL